MVSQDSCIASAMNITRQCVISDTNTGSTHSEDLCSNFPWSRRNQNDFICADVPPPHYESYGGNICRPTNLLRHQHSEESDIFRRLSVNLQGGKQNDRQGFNSEQGQRLALSLNCHFPADPLSNLSQCSQVDQWSEDQRNRARHIGEYTENNCMSQTSFSPCIAKPSYSTSAGMPSFNSLLQNSRYLRPAQQLLDEVVCVSNIVENESLNPLKNIGATRALQPELLNFQDRETLCLKGCSTSEKDNGHPRIAKLMALLKELENQYEKYCHQMNGVISSFELIAGTDAAKSYVTLTIQAMSLHFSNLREAIITQLEISKSPSVQVSRNCRNVLQLNQSGQNHTKALGSSQNLGMIPLRQVWRPLRGLPENSVAILRTWLFEHFLHPYPNDNEKLMLSTKTGLTRNQISNWFINARVRLWKPMIEEMYKEEFTEDPHDLNPSS